MPSVTSQLYATNIIFLRRDHFFASEGGVQAFCWIGGDRGNLLVLCAEAQLDICPLQLSLRLLSFNCLRTCGVGQDAAGFTGRRSRVPLHIRHAGAYRVHMYVLDSYGRLQPGASLDQASVGIPFLITHCIQYVRLSCSSTLTSLLRLPHHVVHLRYQHMRCQLAL